MKSKRGIYYNINESDYKYHFNLYTFYFSSKTYLEKFKEKLESYIAFESDKIGVKYKCKFDSDIMFALCLYKNIEKRGFRVEENNVIIKEDYKITSILSR